MQLSLALHSGDAFSGKTIQINSNSQEFCFERGGIRRGWAVGWLGCSVCDPSTELILKSSLVGQGWVQTLLTCNIFVIGPSILVSPPSHQDLLCQWRSILMTKHLSLSTPLLPTESPKWSLYTGTPGRKEETSWLIRDMSLEGAPAFWWGRKWVTVSVCGFGRRGHPEVDERRQPEWQKT